MLRFYLAQQRSTHKFIIKKTRVTKTEQIQQSINEAVNSDDDSMSALIQKESKTKEYLAPSYWPSVKKKLNEYIQKYKSKKGAQDNSFSSLKNQDEKIRNEAPTTTPIKKNYFYYHPWFFRKFTWSDNLIIQKE